MRGIYTTATQIRRKVFAEIAKLAYEGGDYTHLEEIPYKIIPGEIPQYRDSVFIERAIVGERLRLAAGLPLRPMDKHAPLASDLEEGELAEKICEMPLINVIKFACNACPETSYFVTNNCQSCFAHPCTSVCPVKAISIKDRTTTIDPDKCIKCGRCKDACPYSAIVKRSRPCADACGVDAIESDDLGRASINYDKCVACGQCIVSCPFSAISDKSEIYQLIYSIKAGDEVIAAIAPAFVGQFGPLATPEKIRGALKELGLSDVYEVAIGADIGAVAEAHHYAEEVATGNQPFLATSCCPSWSVMVKNNFPELADCISQELTPMVATARVIKKEHPNAKVVFIGPCSAKKLEALRKSVRSDVDFVITFEELMGMFAAKDIDFGTVEDTPLEDASGTGRGYAVAGGVSSAIERCMKELYPEIEMKKTSAAGLRECKKMLTVAKAGKYNGYLLEGMACPGGCVSGMGTLQPFAKAVKSVELFQKNAPEATGVESNYVPAEMKEKESK